jgi:hypothetical protein
MSLCDLGDRVFHRRARGQIELDVTHAGGLAI